MGAGEDQIRADVPRRRPSKPPTETRVEQGALITAIAVLAAVVCSELLKSPNDVLRALALVTFVVAFALAVRARRFIANS